MNNFKHSSFENNTSEEENKKNSETKNKLDKILCNHCGRTAINGIRCLGFCVADNDY
tara:strand:+ start:153 stop:323 length:171 start_codon:yes stop_codon:yes gene_type:complete